jgi:uncharacterized protein
MKKKLNVYNVVIALILALIVIIGSLVLFVNPNGKTRQSVPVVEESTPSAPAKPVFRKDGELQFLEGKSEKVISKISVEVADDDAEREQGLMYRDSMAEDQGMLFMMTSEEIQTFWMKNTILSLDIIYVNSDRRIVSIKQNCKPYSLETIPSDEPAMYVVEVIAGYAVKYGLKPGDRIVF